MNTIEKLKYDVAMERGSDYEYLANASERVALLEKSDKEKTAKFAQALFYMSEAYQSYAEAYMIPQNRQDEKEIMHSLAAMDRTKERKASIIKKMDNTKTM